MFFRGARWTLAGLGVLLLLSGGASVFWQPAEEVLFDLQGPLAACTGSGCFMVYTLEVGNTGTEAQADVRVRLRARVLDEAVLPAAVRDFGKIERAVEVTEGDGVRSFALGRVEPGRRVEVSFTLQRAHAGSAPTWDEIFVGVEPAAGQAVRGDPASVSLARIWYRLLAW